MIATDPVRTPATIFSAISPEFEAIEKRAARALRWSGWLRGGRRLTGGPYPERGSPERTNPARPNPERGNPAGRSPLRPNPVRPRAPGAPPPTRGRHARRDPCG